jgi:hypothetical protein
MIYNIIIECGNNLVWVNYSEFNKKLAIFARYNKLLIILLVITLLVNIIIVINFETFIVYNKLLKSSATWVNTSNIYGILVSVI